MSEVLKEMLVSRLGQDELRIREFDRFMDRQWEYAWFPEDFQFMTPTDDPDTWRTRNRITVQCVNCYWAKVEEAKSMVAIGPGWGMPVVVGTLRYARGWRFWWGVCEHCDAPHIVEIGGRFSE